MAATIPSTKLSNGVDIPLLAFGTGTVWYKADRFSAPNADMVTMLGEAIKAGYRHLDTAEGYGTETELGEAIRKSGVPRQDFFITTKGINTISEQGVDQTTQAVEDSLKRLGVGYLDLYLLHSPYVKDNKYDQALVARVWQQLESFQRAGKIRSIGVSNFRKHHIENLLRTAEVKPVLNQIQFNPYLQGAPSYARWLQSQGIAVATFKGLGPITNSTGKHLGATLESLATKYGASKATILIRWQLDLGCVVVNTTQKVERFQEFLAAPALDLSREDHEKVTNIGQETHIRTPVPPLFDGGEHEPYES